MTLVDVVDGAATTHERQLCKFTKSWRKRTNKSNRLVFDKRFRLTTEIIESKENLQHGIDVARVIQISETSQPSG